MNKMLNTFLFIVGATVLNIGIMIILMVILFLIPAVLLNHNVYKKVMPYLNPVLFIGAIVATFFIYNRLIKWFSKRVDMEKYFHPIFKRKR